MTRPRLALAPLALVGALGLAGAPLARGDAANDPTPAQAITELNAWRAQIGDLPVAATPVASWDSGCGQANTYDFDNLTLTHQEVSTNPGYTPAGAEAASDSVLASREPVGEAPAEPSLLPGPVWDSSVFHRAALLEPRLEQVGFDSSTFNPGGSVFDSDQCMWVENDAANNIPAIDNSETTPGLTLYPSPANGAYDVPTTFPAGTESPNPADETGVPPGATLGWLLNVEMNGPWANAYGGADVFANGVRATLAPDGSTTQVPVVVSQCGTQGCAPPDSGGTTDGPEFGGGFGIFPTQPLQANTTYRVVLTAGQVTDLVTNYPTATSYPIPTGYSWCFSTGSSYTPSSDCAASSTGAGVEPFDVAPSSGSGSGSRSGSGSGSGSAGGGSGSSGSAPTPGRAVGPPTVSHGSLSGVRSGTPKLSFDVTAGLGAADLKTIAVSLPQGLQFTSGKPVDRGLSVTPVHGRKLKVVARLSHGRLTITLPAAESQVAVKLGGSALRASHAFVSSAKRRHVCAVKVTDASGTATKLRLSVKP